MKNTLSLALLVLFTGCAMNNSSPPLERPFSVAEAGHQIEFPLVVNEDKFYEFDLNFRSSHHNSKGLIEMLGHWGFSENDRGARVHVKLTITRIANRNTSVEFEKDANGLQWISSSPVGQNKLIAIARLKPGTFKIRLENKFAAPQFSPWPAYLQIKEDIRMGAFKDR